MYQATRDVATETYAIFFTWKRGLDSNVCYFIFLCSSHKFNDFFRDIVFRAINVTEMEAMLENNGRDPSPDYPFNDYSYPEIEGDTLQFYLNSLLCSRWPVLQQIKETSFFK